MIELDKVTPPRITVTMGFTRNMHNFESLRIDLGLEASALPGETSADALERVYGFVEKALEEKFVETENELKKAGLGSS